jgi:uncharacterized protein
MASQTVAIATLRLLREGSRAATGPGTAGTVHRRAAIGREEAEVSSVGLAMRLQGKTVIAASCERVWEFLTDPIAVSDCAPGVKSVEVVVPGKKFRVLATVGLGSVQARFATDVEWLDLEKPHRASMKAHGTAPVGAADVTTAMTLADGPDGTTELAWTAEVAVAGTIASFAARLLGSVSTRLTGAFFACVRRKLEDGAERPPDRRRHHGKRKV